MSRRKGKHVRLRKWAHDNWGLIVITLLTAVFSPIWVEIVPNETLHPSIKFFLVAAYIVLALATALSEMSRQSTEAKLRARRSEVEGQLSDQLRGVLVRGGLLHGVSHEISELLSEVRREIVQANAEGTPERMAVARERSIKAALRSLSEILRSDRTRTRDERLAATYFKATLFEWDGSEGDEGVLRRAYWHYPITKRLQVRRFDIVHDATSGAVQCYKNATLILPSYAALGVSKPAVHKRQDFSWVPDWLGRDYLTAMFDGNPAEQPQLCSAFEH